MKECIFDGLFDTLKLMPYLFVTFLILEFIEHKLKNKNKKVLSGNKKYGPFFGGLFGAVPQCGFSSMAANLFSARVITLGTLIAVFLSTSDEMIPIMLSEKTNIFLLLRIVLFKVFVGIVIGFIIDLIYQKNKSDNNTIKDLCDHDHCGCDHDNIILSSIKHTIKISLFILFINLSINLFIYKIGEENLSNLLLHNNIFSYFLSSFVGLIPNCAGSVLITELYVTNFISIGTLLSGLLTGSGLGILLLFKTNKNLKENITILSFIYIIGVLIGFIVDLVL